MISASDKTAYKALLASEALPKDVLDHAFKAAETGKVSFWKLLTDSAGLGEYGLYEILSKQTGTPVIHLKQMQADKRALDKVPVKVAWYYKFYPYKLEDGRVWIAVSQLPDVSMLDEIRFSIGLEVGIAYAPEKEIEEMLNRHYGLGADMVNKILSQKPEPHASQMPISTHEVEDLEKMAETASIAQLVNQIILEAYKKRASDIHLEPFRGKIRLRYRIDGVLHEAPVPSEMKKFFAPMLARIKIMANLNVVEKRLPQDGKMRVKAQDQALDLRVSCIPTTHGESMVIRILPGKNVWSLDHLGFDPHYLKVMKSLLQKPNGILFVTGPTGSGKSTTLYACLTLLNQEERKVITIEDPVEYELEGITQIQVASDVGMTFSQGLRSVLRHDPDVLMVGEVRDLETADISIRAALTGHLILSTLHTNDAASGITRLTDIGVEPYLAASSVIAFVAQRLVRVNCEKCKQPHTDLDEKTQQIIKESLGLASAQEITVYRGKGCEHCNGTGYAGRQAIHEILVLDEDIRKLIMERVPAETIKKKAMHKGMQTLLQDGFKKVLEGLTTPEEIIRVAPADHAELSPEKASEGEMSAVYFPVGSQEENASGHPSQEKKELEKSDANRRKYKRVSVHLPVTYRIIDYHGHHPQVAAVKNQLSQTDLEGEAENLSAGGLMYASDNMILEGSPGAEAGEITIGDALEAGSILELQIKLPDGGKPVRCIGRVLRIAPSVKVLEENKFIFHVAVLFLVIHSVDRMRIEKFCESAEESS